jgi:hypothetical protein
MNGWCERNDDSRDSSDNYIIALFAMELKKLNKEFVERFDNNTVCGLRYFFLFRPGN